MKPVNTKNDCSRFPKIPERFKRKTLSASIFALLLVGFQAPAMAVDTDGDGIDDAIDLDDDNDGIPDSVEDSVLGIAPPASCSHFAQFITDGELFDIDLQTGASTLVHDFGIQYNGTGYNPFDGLVWGAVRDANQGLLYDPQTFATVSTFPMPDFFNSGDINILNKTWVVAQPGLNPHVYDADPTSATYQTLIDTYDVAPGNFPDIIFDGNTGLFYGILGNSSDLYSLDPSDGWASASKLRCRLCNNRW